MPHREAQGHDAASLAELIDATEEAGDEVVQVVKAGDSWLLVTKHRQRKPQTRA